MVINDQYGLFREGLKAIIARETQYKIVGETGSGREALQFAQDLKPDLILMDIALSDRSGIDLTRDIKERLPDVRVMIVSMHSKIDYIVKAFQAGATGYVVKDSAFKRLLQGIDCVLNGELFIDSSISHKVLEKLMGFPDKRAKKTRVKHYLHEQTQCQTSIWDLEISCQKHARDGDTRDYFKKFG